MPDYPLRLPARARRARAQLFGLMSRRPRRADYPPDGLLLVLEAAALHRAATTVLRRLHAPHGLSAAERTSWYAARTAAVLALIAEAEQIAPAPPQAQGAEEAPSSA
ncbi:hypothetical protein [Streptomyces sp. NPDC002526]